MEIRRSCCGRVNTSQEWIGQRVEFVGVAEARKIGAALRGKDFYVWIDGLYRWPSGYAGRRVEVVGVVEERHDLPVFIPQPDKPLVQGIPVPEGTDLHEASRRFVVRDAQWRVLQFQ